MLYPRTVANIVFDAIARNAIKEFSSDSSIKIKIEPQTVKFIFGNKVVARFKKGDANFLGQNHPTRSVLDFIHMQQTLPGFPPDAAKVDITWKPTELGDAIDAVMVVARDLDHILWSYPIPQPDQHEGVVELLLARDHSDEEDDRPLVVPKPKLGEVDNPSN